MLAGPAPREHMIVIVEHNLAMVLALADRVFGLDRSAVLCEGLCSLSLRLGLSQTNPVGLTCPPRLLPSGF
jgi:ABC-type Mn2+/Zn2+ transport system ATPase subunit